MIKLIRTYLDIKGIIHNYTYDKEKMISKAKCNKCHSKMVYIFANKLGKHIKLGFICFDCNIIYINDNHLIIKCRINVSQPKRMK